MESLQTTSTEEIISDISKLNITESNVKAPGKVLPPSPFDKSRMSTVVVYGWEPWENVIGKKGIEMAAKLFREFDADPVRNVKKNELKALAPSLKIIMSSKLAGLDRYLESKDDQDDIPYSSYDNWLYCLHERFRGIAVPDTSRIYQSANADFEKEKEKSEKRKEKKSEIQE